jgi:hypothetical protein
VVKKTKKKVRPADTKAKVKLKAMHSKTLRATPVKKLARRTDASLQKTQHTKKPVLQISQPPVTEVQRADLAPGYSLVVDGQIKAQFDGQSAAKKAAKELLANYPILKVEIQDASTGQRTLVTN